MYGHGNSDGQFENHTLYKWLTNALTVIDYARGLDFVTGLYLCGHSQGGMTVMLAGAMKHDVISGLIPLSPAWMIPELARKGTLLGQDFDPDHIPDVIPAWGDRGLGGNYVRVAQTIHVEEAADRYKGPVLILHGDEDDTVPPEDSRRMAQRYQLRRALGRLDRGDPRHADHVALLRLTGGDERERPGLHADHARGARDAVGFGLGRYVDHVRLALCIEMRQGRCGRRRG
jgi:pimeloyl-ACP methyl ester carboxylesterase